MKKKAKIIGGLVAAGIFCSLILVLYLYQTKIIEGELARLSTTGIGALATAVLALATFFSMSQTEETLEDIQREREKPIKIDILSEVIDPAINDVKVAKERISSEIQWQIYHDEREPHNDLPEIIKNKADEFIIKEIENNEKNILDKLNIWEDKSKKVHRSGVNLIRSLDEADNFYTNDQINLIMEPSENNKPNLNSSSIQVSDLYPKFNEELHEYWRARRDYSQFLDELHEFLINKKLEMMKEYGISDSEVP